MNHLRITTFALMGLVFACGGDDNTNSPGGATGGTAGSGDSGGISGKGGTGGSEHGGEQQGGGGGAPDLSSSFTASGTATPASGEPFTIELDKNKVVEVVQGHGYSAVNFTRFEGLWASDIQLAKSYLGVEYSLLIDILDTKETALVPGQYNDLGSKGAVLTIKYDAGMWHTFHLVVDKSKGDYVRIEEGTQESSEANPLPHIKAAYQLSFKSYMDMSATTIPASGSLTGRLDGFFSVHQDSSATYAE